MENARTEIAEIEANAPETATEIAEIVVDATETATKMKHPKLLRLLAKVGGSARLAKQIGITRQGVYKWPEAMPDHIDALERISGMPRWELSDRWNDPRDEILRWGIPLDQDFLDKLARRLAQANQSGHAERMVA
jgi:hypothetical protein